MFGGRDSRGDWAEGIPKRSSGLISLSINKSKEKKIKNHEGPSVFIITHVRV